MGRMLRVHHSALRGQMTARIGRASEVKYDVKVRKTPPPQLTWRPSGCSTFEDIGKNAARGSLRSSAKCRVVRHIAEEVLHGPVLQLRVDLVSTQSISTEGIELMIEVLLQIHSRYVLHSESRRWWKSWPKFQRLLLSVESSSLKTGSSSAFGERERTVEPIIDLLVKVPKIIFPVPRDNIFWSFWSFEDHFRLVF